MSLYIASPHKSLSQVKHPACLDISKLNTISEAIQPILFFISVTNLCEKCVKDVYHLNNQLFFDENLLKIYCLFWIDEKDHSTKIKYHSKSCPFQVVAKHAHSLHFSLRTNPNHEYNVNNEININEEFELNYFCGGYCTYKFFPYDVDPGPDKVKSKIIDVDYEVHAESGKSQKMRLRFENFNQSERESMRTNERCLLCHEIVHVSLDIGQVCSDCRNNLQKEAQKVQNQFNIQGEYDYDLTHFQYSNNFL